jgi:hypothetical protein
MNSNESADGRSLDRNPDPIRSLAAVARGLVETVYLDAGSPEARRETARIWLLRAAALVAEGGG